MKDLEYARQVTRSQIVRVTALGLLGFAIACLGFFVAAVA